MRTFLCFLLLGAWLPGSAQFYFNNRYHNPTPGAQTLFNTITPTDSGYLSVGLAIDYPQFNNTSLLLRFLDQRGQISRDRFYEARAFIPGAGHSLQALPQGGYALIGGQSNFPQGARTWLWRFNALGDTLWTRKLPSPHGDDNGQNLAYLPSGDYVLIGSSSLDTLGNISFLLTRTDSLGNVRWQRTYQHGFQAYGWSITATPDGGFLLGGYTTDRAFPAPTLQTLIIKTDSLGNEEWFRLYGAPRLQSGIAMTGLLPNGNLVVAASNGKSFDPNTQLALGRPVIRIFSPQGQLLHAREIGPSRDLSDAYALQVLPDGSLVVAGQQGDSTAQQLPEGYLYKLCPRGDSVWFRSYKRAYGPNSQNVFRDMRPTPDGGFVAAGFLWVFPPDSGASDAWVLKVDSAGYLQAGGAPPTVRCTPLGLPAPGAAPALALYPNPTAPDGRFTLEAPPGATLTLTDALGRPVWRTSHRSPLTSNLKLPRPGLYLLRLTWPDGRSVTRKLVRE